MDKSIALVHRKPMRLRMDWLVTLFSKKTMSLEKILAFQMAEKRMENVHMMLDERIRMGVLR